MEWILLIIAVHVNDPRDIPGKVEVQMSSQQSCEQALATLKYEFKFKSFKVDGRCVNVSSLSQTTTENR
jgi:hypothetical protein